MDPSSGRGGRMAHPKGLLIERAQQLGLGKPELLTAKTGPDHEPSFLTDVLVGGEVVGTGQGGSKREAERAAAEEALRALSEGARESSAEDDSGSDSGEFSGPWPMLESLLASVVSVAERRVQSDLRGAEALSAIRDFSLELYKDLIADLGEVVEEDEE